jgi:hypothetical protein
MDRNDDRSRHAELDDVLRRALEPEPATVENIVTRALHAEAGSAAPRPTRLAPRLAWARAAAVVLLCAGVIGLWWSVPRPVPPARGTIFNEGDIIVVVAPDQPITLIGSGLPTSTPPPGTGSIVLLGEPR